MHSSCGFCSLCLSLTLSHTHTICLPSSVWLLAHLRHILPVDFGLPQELGRLHGRVDQDPVSVHPYDEACGAACGQVNRDHRGEKEDKEKEGDRETERETEMSTQKKRRGSKKETIQKEGDRERERERIPIERRRNEDNREIARRESCLPLGSNPCEVPMKVMPRTGGWKRRSPSTTSVHSLCVALLLQAVLGADSVKERECVCVCESQGVRARENRVGRRTNRCSGREKASGRERRGHHSLSDSLSLSGSAVWGLHLQSSS